MELETFNQQRSAQELLVSCSRSKPVEVQKRCACFWVEEISGGGYVMPTASRGFTCFVVLIAACFSFPVYSAKLQGSAPVQSDVGNPCSLCGTPLPG